MYGSAPLRIVRYDLVNDTIQLIATIPKYVGVNIGSFCNYMVIKEDTNQAIVVTDNRYILSISLLDGSLQYYKQYGAPSSSGSSFRYNHLIRKSSDGFILRVGSFEGRTYTGSYGLVKIRYSDGSLISEYPVSPTVNNVRVVWDSSPDGRKQVLISSTTPSIMYICIDGVWSSAISLPETGQTNVLSAVIHNDCVYLMVGDTVTNSVHKYNLDGSYNKLCVPSTQIIPLRNRMGLSSLGNMQSNGLAVHNGSIFVIFPNGLNVYKFNEETGLRDTSFFGIIKYRSGRSPSLRFYGNKMLVDRDIYAGEVADLSNFLLSRDSYKTTNNGSTRKAFVIDTNTKEILSTGSSSFSFNPYLQFEPITSPSLPNKVIAFTTIQFRVYDVSGDTWQIDSGWPSISNNSYAALALDGEYMYVACNPISNVTWSDANGTWSGFRRIVRINLTTKLLDRTFDVTLPNAASFNQDKGNIAVTSNYVYLSMGGFWRIEKTTGIATQILPATLGLTSTTLTNRKIYVNEVGGGDIIIYCYFATLDSKVYRRYNEETLTLSGNQPANTTTDRLGYPIYVPETKKLVGAFSTSAGGRILSFNVETGERQPISQAFNTNQNPSTAERNIGSIASVPEIQFTGSISRIAYKDGKYYIALNGAIVYDLKPYFGVIVMNDNGEIES
jgi:hypothetical protein